MQGETPLAEIVNLRQARKSKARAEREAEAAANRRRFGRTKAEKAVEKDEARRNDSSLAGKRLEEKES
jgi:hypothetical protein